MHPSDILRERPQRNKSPRDIYTAAQPAKKANNNATPKRTEKKARKTAATAEEEELGEETSEEENSMDVDSSIPSNSGKSGSSDGTADILKKMEELSAQEPQSHAENARLRKEMMDEKLKHSQYHRPSCPAPATPAPTRAPPVPLFTSTTPATDTPAFASHAPASHAPANPAPTPYPYYYVSPAGHQPPPAPSPSYPFNPHYHDVGAAPYYAPYYQPPTHPLPPPGYVPYERVLHVLEASREREEKQERELHYQKMKNFALHGYFQGP